MVYLTGSAQCKYVFWAWILHLFPYRYVVLLKYLIIWGCENVSISDTNWLRCDDNIPTNMPEQNYIFFYSKGLVNKHVQLHSAPCVIYIIKPLEYRDSAFYSELNADLEDCFITGQYCC